MTKGLQDIVHKVSLGASTQLTIPIPHKRPNYVGRAQDVVRQRVTLHTKRACAWNYHLLRYMKYTTSYI